MSEGQDDLPKIGPPLLMKSYDLASDTKATDNGPPLSAARSDLTNPARLMKELGFNPSKYMNPMQFLIAVINDDIDLIFKNPVRRKRMMDRGGLAMSHRISAARVAVKFMHSEMAPIGGSGESDSKFADAMAAAVAKGEARVVRKHVILETVEAISPKVPLAPATYPTAFSDIEHRGPAQEIGDDDDE